MEISCTQCMRACMYGLYYYDYLDVVKLIERKTVFITVC